MTRYLPVIIPAVLASLFVMAGIFGVVRQRQLASPDLLIGVWQLDAKRTLSFQGFRSEAEARPDIVAHLQRTSIAATLNIRADQSFQSFDGKNQLQRVAEWSATESSGSNVTSELKLVDGKGQVMFLEWRLMTEDLLKVTFPGENKLVYRRVSD